jgi:hypothetical protein
MLYLPAVISFRQMEHSQMAEDILFASSKGDWPLGRHTDFNFYDHEDEPKKNGHFTESICNKKE